MQSVANSAGDQNWMEQEVQREYAQVADAARADTQKPYTNADFESSILGLLNFARNRSAQVTAQVAASRK